MGLWGPRFVSLGQHPLASFVVGRANLHVRLDFPLNVYDYLIFETHRWNLVDISTKKYRIYKIDYVKCFFLVSTKNEVSNCIHKCISIKSHYSYFFVQYEVDPDNLTRPRFVSKRAWPLAHNSINVFWTSLGTMN